MVRPRCPSVHPPVPLLVFRCQPLISLAVFRRHQLHRLCKGFMALDKSVKSLIDIQLSLLPAGCLLHLQTTTYNYIHMLGFTN